MLLCFLLINLGIKLVFKGLGWYKVKIEEIFLIEVGFNFFIIFIILEDFNWNIFFKFLDLIKL